MHKILSSIALSAMLISLNSVHAMGETDDGKVKFTADKDVWGGKWTHFKGKFNEKFGKLMHDDAAVEKGDRQKIAGLMQEKYGWTKVEAEEKLDEFVRSHNEHTANNHTDHNLTHTSVHPSKTN